MIYVGSKVKIIYNGVESDELIVDSIDGDQCRLIRESTMNSCGWFDIDKLIVQDDNNETV